jgi:hypothetical protein
VTTALPPLVFAATYGSQSRHGTALRRDAQRGLLHRVHPGAYVEAADWERLDRRERHVLTTKAVMAGLSPRVVVSHASAVALHGLPSVDWPRGPVHVIDPGRDRTQATARVVRHPGPIGADDTVDVDGIAVTSEARTAVDRSRTGSFADGVLCVDAVLRRAAARAGCFALLARRDPRSSAGHRSRVDAAADAMRRLLSERLDGEPGTRGLSLARQVMAFGTPWAENGGESLCRLALLELGAPEPVMQVEFFDGEGLAGRCDFVIGDAALEFDGKAKYDDDAMRAGQVPSVVVKAEKARARRLVRSGGIKAIGRCDSEDVALRLPLVRTLRDLDIELRPRQTARMWPHRQV